jgi:hypothetical protein
MVIVIDALTRFGAADVDGSVTVAVKTNTDLVLKFQAVDAIFVEMTPVDGSTTKAAVPGASCVPTDDIEYTRELEYALQEDDARDKPAIGVLILVVKWLAIEADNEVTVNLGAIAKISTLTVAVVDREVLSCTLIVITTVLAGEYVLDRSRTSCPPAREAIEIFPVTASTMNGQFAVANGAHAVVL